MTVGITLDASKIDNTNTTATTIDGYHDVPAQNAATNAQMRDVIGNKTDSSAGDSLYAIGHTLEEHFHTASKMYPTLADGVTLTASAAGWTLGNFAEIIPADTITDTFDIHYVSVEAISANDVYEIVLYAATTEIGRCRFAKTAAQEGTQNIPMQTVLIPANTQIQAKIACKSTNARTVTVSLFYHTY